MAHRHISQEEARRYKRRAEELEELIDEQRRTWIEKWPTGVQLSSMDISGYATVGARVETARQLKHAVVATVSDDGKLLKLFALPLAKVPEK